MDLTLATNLNLRECGICLPAHYMAYIALPPRFIFAKMSIYCIIFAKMCCTCVTKIPTATMVNISPVIFAHHRRKDGTYPVKICVTFRRGRKYLPTTIYCRQADLTRSLKIKNPDITAKVNAV